MSDQPTVLFFTRADDVVDVYLEHLPPGWRFLSLASRDDEQEKLALLPEADFLVHVDLPITAAHLDAATRLRMITRQGVGLDGLDTELLRARGIPGCNCPAGTTDAVADHALALLLGIARHLCDMDHDVRRRGLWPKWEYRLISQGLSGRTVGLVGFGSIGQAVARRLQGFGCDVLVHRRSGRRLAPEWPAGRFRFTASLEEVFSQSDAVSLHLPLTDGTRGLVGGPLLRSMKPGALLVNTARGPIIDEGALVEVLAEGRLGGVALDVLSQEPPPPDHPLFSFPNVVVTPHTGSGTRQAQEVKARELFANMRRCLEGKELKYRVV